MYRSATLGLTAIVSAALGAAAMQTIHAQATPHAFLIVENAVTNQDAYNKEYGPVIGKAVEDHGGKILARAGKTLAESLVELILLAPEEEQGKLLAAAIAHLGQAFLEKSGDGEDGQDTTH